MQPTNFKSLFFLNSQYENLDTPEGERKKIKEEEEEEWGRDEYQWSGKEAPLESSMSTKTKLTAG